jgi:hypothetical protein
MWRNGKLLAHKAIGRLDQAGHDKQDRTYLHNTGFWNIVLPVIGGTIVTKALSLFLACAPFPLLISVAKQFGYATWALGDSPSF